MYTKIILDNNIIPMITNWCDGNDDDDDDGGGFHSIVYGIVWYFRTRASNRRYHNIIMCTPHTLTPYARYVYVQGVSKCQQMTENRSLK